MNKHEQADYVDRIFQQDAQMNAYVEKKMKEVEEAKDQLQVFDNDLKKD